MKLLIVTQVMDEQDPVLGFFHRWVLEFAKHVESVIVICLKEGEHALPENVKVYSLGKEHGERSSASYSLAFKSLASKLRNEYDHVFVHMNPEYLIIMGFWWRVWKKPVALWYMHKTVSWRLIAGALFANVIFTASPKSMRLMTSKKRVVGHGVDIAALSLLPVPTNESPLSLVTVGRLSPVKRLEILIDTVKSLKEKGVPAVLTIAGGAAGKDGEEYARALRARVSDLHLEEVIHFIGPIPHSKLPEVFADAHLFLHASNTGSLDKASLEPLAVGLPVITVDEELASAGIPAIILAKPTSESFSGAVQQAINTRPWADPKIRSQAREYVEKNHELGGLITRILAEPAFTGHR